MIGRETSTPRQGAASAGSAAPGGTPAVRCAGLTKRFGQVAAVDGLDLRIERGAVLALLGPSGCGKTTTLRLIAGFEAPDEGRIEIAGRVVAEPGRALPPEARRVGMVFQDFALFPHLSVAENVDFGLRAQPLASRRQHTARMLALVGLAGLGERYPHELSGGQQQRVALARALAPSPEVLLLDEPFSNLDARMRQVVREEIRDILRATHTSALFVTHDQEEALFMGDEVAVLNGGRLEQVDVPERLYARPATRFVADFLGHTSFLAGRVAGEGEGLRTSLGRLALVLPLPEGAEVELLVRPDDLLVLREGPVNARVERRIFLGMHQLYRLRMDDGILLKALAPAETVIHEGEPVCLALRPERRWVVYHEGRAVE